MGAPSFTLVGLQFLIRSSFSPGKNGDIALVSLAPPEFHYAICEGIKGVVLSDPDIQSRVVLGATLTHEDVACDALLTAINLDAQPFAF